MSAKLYAILCEFWYNIQTMTHVSFNLAKEETL
jgi:hypothetical protein